MILVMDHVGCHMHKGSRQKFPEPGWHIFTTFYDVDVVYWVLFHLVTQSMQKENLVSEFGIAPKGDFVTLEVRRGMN